VRSRASDTGRLGLLTAAIYNRAVLTRTRRRSNKPIESSVMRVTFLGTGTSHGVPAIDCMMDDYARCPANTCRKALTDPIYRRTRASVLFQWGDASLLVDTSQDFYWQVHALKAKRIDGVLFTHAHADHIYGLPDIRSYSRRQGSPIPIYGSEETLGILETAFGYVFHPPEFVGGGIPALEPHVVDGPFVTLGRDVIPVPVEHGRLAGCLGYRIGDVAYLPDVHGIPHASLCLLQRLELLILNCLRFRPHASHLCLDESLAYVEALRPQRCLFTHLAHDIDAREHAGLLPNGVAFAYDGQTVDVS